MTTILNLVGIAAGLLIIFLAVRAIRQSKLPELGPFQVMLDLETLGTKPGCKVLSIGAAMFNKYGVSDTFYIEVKRGEGQDMLEEDPDTVQWWSEQSPEAKTLLGAPDSDKDTLALALIKFNQWLEQVAGKDERGNCRAIVWGNGSDFDNAILAHCYKAVNVKQGWPFWSNRCYRTLKGLLPNVKLQRTGTHHNALDDAVSQAEHAVELLQELGLWGQ